MNKEFVEEMKAKLLEKKQTVLAELAGIPSHIELSATDAGENSEEVEMDMVNQNLRVQLNQILTKVEKALEKVQEGTYGVDDDGVEISEERLRAVPWADKAL